MGLICPREVLGPQRKSRVPPTPYFHVELTGSSEKSICPVFPPPLPTRLSGSLFQSEVNQYLLLKSWFTVHFPIS